MSHDILQFCVATVASAGVETLPDLLIVVFYTRFAVMTFKLSALPSCYIMPNPRLTYASPPSYLASSCLDYHLLELIPRIR